jgi:hypothetical protein
MRRHSRGETAEALRAAIRRVRAEFEEMPCLRVTLAEASALFGLGGGVCSWVLGRLEAEGFLTRTPRGQYVRHTPPA